jgi:MscS family membrane protein
VAIIREILEDHEGMDPELPPRVYFSDFNDWSLNILVIYWYHPPDYWAYLAFGEQFNLEVFKRFNKEGIEFAFPTQTLYLANDDKRQLAVRRLGEQTSLQG